MAKLFEGPRFLAIEGPLRVGKSSLAAILAERMSARLVVEPENNPFLDRFYQAQPGMAFATQMWFLKERHAQLSQLQDFSRPIVADYVFEKDKIFAYLNLGDAELDLYRHYYQMLREDVPPPDLVVYLQATPEVLKQRLRRKAVPGERAISDAYIEQVVEAYEHFFFHYTASDLLVVNTSEIDFVHNNRDLQLLLTRLAEPVQGMQFFLPLGEKKP
jgi:deoxyguanosine kinase